jgi:alkanesulfonate monooxygenase SsuD/methylene tetrahydromethanopterin reductase-like flavin-dependent oxidoreductase (luciferase family)
MPYVDINPDFAEKHGGAWVTLPNTYFDRKAGFALYNRFLDELEYADASGFDGVCVNEHHQNGYGLMPMPGHSRDARRVGSPCSAARYRWSITR